MLSKLLLLCVDGTKAHPAKSCADLLRQRKNIASGYYWVKPIQTGNDVHYVYCDMTSYGKTLASANMLASELA